MDEVVYSSSRWREALIAEFDEETNFLRGAVQSLTLRELQSCGLALLGLVIASVDSGMFGRKVLTCHHRKGTEEVLPTVKLTPGDLVSFHRGKFDIEKVGILSHERSSITGIITKLTESSISLVIDNTQNGTGSEDEEPLEYLEGAHGALLLNGDQRHHEKQMTLLNRMENWGRSLEDGKGHFVPSRDMIEIGFGITNGSSHRKVVDASHSNSSNTAFEFKGKAHVELNASQKQAVVKSIQASSMSDPIHCIHGPPGTGKTTTIGCLLEEAYLRGTNFILCCAPSNVAVDNLVSVAIKSGIPAKHLVRLGHPARVSESILGVTFDSKLSKATKDGGLNKLIREEKKIKTRLKKLDGKKVTKDTYDEVTQERKALRADLREVSRAQYGFRATSVDAVFADTRIVFSTLMGSTSGDLIKWLTSKNKTSTPFDLVIIDEAAQALAPLTWAPMRLARQVILAGDPHQLPPTVKSRTANALGLHSTIMGELIHHGLDCTLLNTQYRMNRHILSWSNLQFYKDRVLSGENCSDRFLNPKLPFDYQNNSGMLWIDTSGTDSCAEDNQNDGNDDDTAPRDERSIPNASSAFLSPSRSNEGEARVIKNLVTTTLLETMGLSSNQIKIISPYRAQVTKLKAMLPLKGLEIGTVDSFQGREGEIVIVSLVRSNDRCTVGFLKDYRRMNVAITRAKQLCILVGNSTTLSNDAVLSSISSAVEPENMVPVGSTGLDKNALD